MQKPSQPAQILDPHGILETVCDGPMYMTANGPFITITFTGTRPRVEDLSIGNALGTRDFIVKARVTMNYDNVAALANLVGQATQVSASDASLEPESRH